MPTIRCPAREELREFVLGTLPEPAAETVAEHIETCPACESILEEFERLPDELLADLRASNPLDEYVSEPECEQSRMQIIATGGPWSDYVLLPPAAAAAPVASRTTLGHYEILDEIGRGAMGTVYRALNTELHKVVAIKLLAPERVRDPHSVARFQQEMRAVGQLEHPNIVRALDGGEANGSRFLVMEYIDGENVEELARRRGPLPVAEACDIVRQAALGLQCVYEHGLVHRDIKPSNLLLTRAGQVKILDLGLARLHDSPALGPGMTAAGQTMGTADYMAPEQIRDSHAVDIRADIYSLGCTLYRLLTGCVPFSGPQYQSACEKMTAHVRMPVPPIRQTRPDIPKSLADVLERMLAKQAADRYATPAEVAAVLSPFCEYSLPSPRYGTGRRRAWIVALTAAAGFLLAALGIYSLSGPRTREVAQPPSSNSPEPSKAPLPEDPESSPKPRSPKPNELPIPPPPAMTKPVPPPPTPRPVPPPEDSPRTSPPEPSDKRLEPMPPKEKCLPLSLTDTLQAIQEYLLDRKRVPDPSRKRFLIVPAWYAAGHGPVESAEKCQRAVLAAVRLFVGAETDGAVEVLDAGKTIFALDEARLCQSPAWPGWHILARSYPFGLWRHEIENRKIAKLDLTIRTLTGADGRRVRDKLQSAAARPVPPGGTGDDRRSASGAGQDVPPDELAWRTVVDRADAETLPILRADWFLLAMASVIPADGNQELYTVIRAVRADYESPLERERVLSELDFAGICGTADATANSEKVSAAFQQIVEFRPLLDRGTISREKFQEKFGEATWRLQLGMEVSSGGYVERVRSALPRTERGQSPARD
jgi:serine/threonine protein kinase